MATGRSGSAAVDAAFTERLAGGHRSVALLLIPILLIALIAGARAVAFGSGLPPQLSSGAGALSPDQLKDGAATKLEALTATGGRGYAFEITQTSTITAKPGGPRIEIPDPNDRFKSLGYADEYLFYSLIERGTVTPTGFWSELRVGPQPGQQPDFENAEWRRSALVRDGVRWRNDRDGWYQADTLPGIGLDPETAARLPSLLRRATEPAATGTRDVDGAELSLVEATGRESDIPGLVMADGEDVTQLIRPIEFGFDDSGRLVRIHAVALNTNMTDFDLVVDTVIVLRYGDPGPLPEPLPTWDPSTTPQD